MAFGYKISNKNIYSVRIFLLEDSSLSNGQSEPDEIWSRALNKHKHVFSCLFMVAIVVWFFAVIIMIRFFHLSKSAPRIFFLVIFEPKSFAWEWQISLNAICWVNSIFRTYSCCARFEQRDYLFSKHANWSIIQITILYGTLRSTNYFRN